jgi:hypothetical protein
VTARRAAAGIALTALAVALALLALAAWRWPARAADEDAQLARRPAPAGAWADGGGIAARMLGARDDAALRRAAVLFARGQPDAVATPRTPEQIVSSAEASIALGEIARSDAPAPHRSRALGMLAVQIAETAVFEPDGAARLAAAAGLLRRAIRLDPRNEAAKANLELLLRLGGAALGESSSGGFGGFGEDAGLVRSGEGY